MNTAEFASAIQDFHRARRRGALRSLLARLAGRSSELLPFEEVRRGLQATGEVPRGLQQIPLDRVVGSVGRYRDFTRDFSPLDDSDEQRWARVRAAVTGPGGLPPIEVYKVGDAYFVKDGNHRVSVARRLGAPTTEAYVTEVRTRVPLSLEDGPDDLILKTEYADFLTRTRLDETRPDADLTLTAPGGYETLLEHISVHRYYMGLERKEDVPFEEAAAHWYDVVYKPVVEAINETGVLRDFPGRTEADLYLFLAEHRAALEAALDWPLSPGAAASDLAARVADPSAAPVSVRERVADALEPAPHTPRRSLCDDVLVAVNGAATGWVALTAALGVARREGSFLYGLHVVPSEAQRESREAEAVRAEFAARCEAAGVRGRLALAVGRVPRAVVERGRLVDLIVLSLNYPPPTRPLARLSSGLRLIIRRSPRPLLLAPPATHPPSHALLAYDGSEKSHEALYAAAYLAGRWGLMLSVLTVGEGRGEPEALTEARDYLGAHRLEAAFISAPGPAAEAILREAELRGCDLILMGAYGDAPPLEAVLGSTVDAVLRARRAPVLVCP